ncbi:MULTISPECIES: hypothetical protein [Clostridium]|jgi:hypothetical protein|nr:MULTISPECIES: hypothetical protein [Clostridium]MDF2504527.1 hypothetical protein [Clostridium sp.]
MRYLIASILIFFILTTLSLCRASSIADRKIESMMLKEKDH